MPSASTRTVRPPEFPLEWYKYCTPVWVSTQISEEVMNPLSSYTLTKRSVSFLAIAPYAYGLSSDRMVLALAARPARPWISLGMMSLVALPSATFSRASRALSLMT